MRLLTCRIRVLKILVTQAEEHIVFLVNYYYSVTEQRARPDVCGRPRRGATFPIHRGRCDNDDGNGDRNRAKMRAPIQGALTQYVRRLLILRTTTSAPSASFFFSFNVAVAATAATAAA